MNMELRFNEAEFSSTEDGTMTVSGYVNETEKPSNVLGTTKKFTEVIPRGVFTRAIETRIKDIDFLAEHDKNRILASTRNNTLVLTEDEKGLFMRAVIVPTSWGKDYYELIASGILQGMSFGFKTIRDSWKTKGFGLFERTINELELTEVSVVRNPAYSGSSIAARGIDLIEDVAIPEEIEKENRDMEKLYEALSTLETRVGELVDELKETRSIKEKELEKREETPVVVEITEEVVAESIVEETPVVEIPAEEITPVVEETEIVEPTPEVIEDETEETEEVPAEEAKRSELEDSLIEFRSVLAELRNGGLSFES